MPETVLKLLWADLNLSEAILGLFEEKRGLSGAVLGCLGAFLGHHLAAILGRLGAILGHRRPFEPILRPSGTPKRPQESRLGAILGRLGPSEDPFEAI